jgi:hypothetical protein
VPHFECAAIIGKASHASIGETIAPDFSRAIALLHNAMHDPLANDLLVQLKKKDETALRLRLRFIKIKKVCVQVQPYCHHNIVRCTLGRAVAVYNHNITRCIT